jgi:SAM-dependent methyltransferase
MICERLTGGRITAIDRSTQMTEAACALNADHIRSGKAAIRTFGLLSCDLPSDAFDKVFLFNLNVFWMDPVEELAEIRRILRSNGIFYLFHQPPPGSDISEYSAKFRENLTLHRFAIIDEIIGSFEPVGAVCLISRPA